MASVEDKVINSTKNKKPYHKPLLEQVSLVIDDTILATGCKFAGTSGPFVPNCFNVGSPLDSCRETGS
jgi:hypothetical protein